ncbi:MAG TPA: hypothetical protein PLC80_11110 [Draconibacterium sp.]|nr:hypothetical protein [Draconibacterium sp.]
MNLRFSVIVVFMFSLLPAGFSAERDTTVQSIFTLIYNQQFIKAEKALEQKNSNVDPFYHNILKLDLFWWKYSLTKSKQDAKVLKQVLDELGGSEQKTREAKINNLIKSSYEMRYEIKRYNFVGALIIRSDVRKQIEILRKEDLTFLGDKRKLFDFYLTLFDYFDENMNPFLFGSKSEKYLKSLSTLEIYSLDKDLILSTMAHYFLGRIYMKVEKQPEKGQLHFRVLSQRFPENSLFKELASGLNTNF